MLCLKRRSGNRKIVAKKLNTPKYNKVVLRSAFLFILAGLAEIGGGYLVWLHLREGRSIWIGVLGAIVLIFYGIIPTLQPTGFDFGRVYATYGGLFVVLSLLWGWIIDQRRPDLPSIVGALIALVGALIIAYWPRG